MPFVAVFDRREGEGEYGENIEDPTDNKLRGRQRRGESSCGTTVGVGELISPCEAALCGESDESEAHPHEKKMPRQSHLRQALYPIGTKNNNTRT